MMQSIVNREQSVIEIEIDDVLSVGASRSLLNDDRRELARRADPGSDPIANVVPGVSR